MNNMFKNVAIWLVIAMVLMTVFNQFNTRTVKPHSMDYSQFMEDAREGRIAKVTIEGRTLKATTTDGKKVTAYAPQDFWLVSDLLKYGVKIEARPEEESSFLRDVFVSWFPMLILIGVWIFFMRQMQGGGRGGAFSFGKSRARMMDESANAITFADVAAALPPALADGWLGAHRQTLATLDGLAARLAATRAGFGAHPVDDGLPAIVPAPVAETV